MNRAVLVVDDDAALAENVAEILTTLEGVEAHVARDGRAALALASAHDFDVALLDVRLPDGDGMALLDPLRASSPFIQLVLVTGNATLEGAIAAVRGDAFAYVLKPVSPPDLLETARRALGQASLYRERERLRRDLERSEERHRELVESMPAFVLALDEQGRITTWNRQLERVTGYPRATMLGTHGAHLVGTDERSRELPVRSGPARRVRWNRAEVPEKNGGPSVFAVGVDVTEEDEMLRRLLRAERLAAVGTLAAGLAHEVRNPLNSAALQLALLERRIERGDTAATTLPIAQIIKTEIDRLDHLVRDFLAFAKPTPFDPKPVAVEPLLHAVAALIGPESEAARVTTTIAASPDLPPVAGDPDRLRQVLLNLTRNSLEALQDAGGHVTMRGRLVAAPDGEGRSSVEIDVEDDGPGFSEQLPIFDAFFTTKGHGTGLGLSVVHRIVTDHDGSIRVQSRPGRTCFTVALPIHGGPRAGAARRPGA